MKNPLKRSENPKGPGPSEMTLLSHLQELRTRIMKMAIAVFIGAIGVWVFFDPIFQFLARPYCDLRDDVAEDCVFIALSPLQPFSVQLQIAGYGGIIVALPVILYQLGRFVLPGLYKHEKKALAPYLVVSTILLAGGMTLAYWFLPRALDVLVNDFGGDRFEAFFSASEYLGFLTKMILAFGIAFQLPVVLVFLQLVGIVQTQTLKSNRRVAIIFVVVLAAVITPTGDPFTLGVLAVPMYLFYELSILIGSRRKKKDPYDEAVS